MENAERAEVIRAKIILAVAPNGGRRGKSDHPALPVTADEIAAEAPAWRDAGASVLHLHVRDSEGAHSLSPEAYGEAIDKLRAAVGDSMVVQITTEAVGRSSPPAQMEAVRAVRPEAASMALRELAPAPEDKQTFADFLAWMQEEHIAAQIILYDRPDLDRLLAWAAEGAIDPARLSVLYVLGRYTANQTSNPVDLLAYLGVTELPFRDWMVCAFGPNELRCAALAALLGGHVRVGFENNLYLAGGKLAARNAELVAQTAGTLEALHLDLASAADVRSLWRIG
jgi:3-keto-5-aminohexanoate cleavage enzyme